jgi:hypothetical protein
VVEEKAGEQKVWKGKIRTIKLSAVPEGSVRAMTALTQSLENVPYLRRRSQIEEEIRQRPVKWRERFLNKPAVQTGGQGESPRPPAPKSVEPEEPMPPTFDVS